MIQTKEPFISVLMVTYNSSRFIKQAIESILNQSYKNFELVICDDLSTDNTWEIVCEYEDYRIKKSLNRHNIGEYSNRNNAIRYSTGDYFIFIDGDDLLYQDGLLILSKYISKYPNCGLMICRPWDERIIYPKVISPPDFYKFEYLDNGICGLNFTKLIFKRSCIIDNPFPLHVKMGDIYIQYKIAMENNILIICDSISWWRRNRGQASEKLLKDQFSYLEHDIWMKLEMLNSDKCPLHIKEREWALSNIYGNYLRFLMKNIIKLKIKKSINLFRKYPIKFFMLRYLFKRQMRNYFDYISGENPLFDEL